MPDSIPRGAVYINGQQVSSKGASLGYARDANGNIISGSWGYYNQGLIYTPEGMVFNPQGMTSNFALFGGQRQDLLRRLNSNIPLDEKAAIRQQLAQTPYEVTYGTSEAPMYVAEPGKIGGTQATVYPEAKTTTTYQPAENGMLVRVEQGGQQAVLLAQQSQTEQDKWGVLPGVQSGVMPATAEGTGWKDTPFYWQIQKDTPAAAASGEGFFWKPAYENFKKAQAAQQVEQALKITSPYREGSTLLEGAIAKRGSPDSWNAGFVYTTPFPYAKPQLEIPNNTQGRLNLSIGLEEQYGQQLAKREQIMQISRENFTPESTTQLQNYFTGLETKYLPETIIATEALKLNLREERVQGGGRNPTPFSFGPMSDIFYSVVPNARPNKAEANVNSDLFRAVLSTSSPGVFHYSASPNEASALAKSALTGVITGTPEFAYSITKMAINASPIGVAPQLAAQGSKGDIFGMGTTMFMHTIVEPVAPIGMFFIGVGSGLREGGISGASAAIMLPAVMLGNSFSKTVNIGYMAGTAVSGGLYGEVAANRPVQLSTDISVRDFGLFGRETITKPSGDISAFRIITGKQTLSSGLTEYSVTDLTPSAYIQRTGAVGGKGILGKFFSGSTEFETTFIKSTGKVFVTPTQESYLFEKGDVYQRGLQIGREGGIGYTSKPFNIDPSATFTGKVENWQLKVGVQKSPMHLVDEAGNEIIKPVRAFKTFADKKLPIDGVVNLEPGFTDTSVVMRVGTYKIGEASETYGFMGLAKPKDVLSTPFGKYPQSNFMSEYVFGQAGTRDYVDIVGVGWKSKTAFTMIDGKANFLLRPDAKSPMRYGLRIISAEDVPSQGGMGIQLGEVVGGGEISVTGGSPIVSVQQMKTITAFRAPTAAQLFSPPAQQVIGGAQSGAVMGGLSAALSFQTTRDTTRTSTTIIPRTDVFSMQLTPSKTSSFLKTEPMARQRTEPVMITIPRDNTFSIMREATNTKTPTLDITREIQLQRSVVIERTSPLMITPEITTPRIPFPGMPEFEITTPRGPPPVQLGGGFGLGSVGSIFDEKPARKQPKRHSPDIRSMTFGLTVSKKQAARISDISGGLIRPLWRK